MAQAATYSFEATTASRVYHVFKNTSWVNLKEGDKVQVELKTNKNSIRIDLNACAIRVKGKYFNATKTVGQIPREISRHAYFLIKEDEGCFHGKVLPVKYSPSPMLSGGLQITLIIKFNCFKLVTFVKMKKFVSELCDYEFNGEAKIDESENEEEMLTMVIDEDQDSVEEKTEEKLEAVSKSLISYEISDEQEIGTIVL